MVTDKTEEMHENEAERAAVTNSKKRASTSDISEEPPTKKMKTPSTSSMKTTAPVQVEEIVPKEASSNCCVCDEPPGTTGKRCGGYNVINVMTNGYV